MFNEIDPDFIKQDDPALFKRWFRDAEDGCDLFVWVNDQKRIARFQFWYQDALVEWGQDRGLRTGMVDRTSGAFTAYQSRIYRLHDDMNNQIVQSVGRLLLDKATPESDILNVVKGILFEMTQESSF